ncbi:MAG: thymidine phosphorylase [Aeriscardovia sp.]|nr:thymidine phosphorylase [Aeriscardovia sp.]
MTIRSLNNAFDSHRVGASRPARPAQFADGLEARLGGGLNPEVLTDMSHDTAHALLSKVHETSDHELVHRVLTIVDEEGIDIIAELWSRSPSNTLPGILWRLYTLRLWMCQQKQNLVHFWRLGEPTAGVASAITGINEYPTAQDITETADSILSGAFTGDFAVALERSYTFIMVVSFGIEYQVRLLERHAELSSQYDEQQRAHRMMTHLRETNQRLLMTAHAFHKGALLWTCGKLE